jgi:nucleoside 2-deoxyribosyltransferase
VRIYLASGWFTPTQKEVRDRVCASMREWGRFVYSPEEESKDIWKGRKPGDCSREERNAVFWSNLNTIVDVDAVVAVIDDFDPGVIFEVGYAFACDTPIIAYSDVKGRGLNLMISQSCVGFCNGIDNLKRGLEFVEDCGMYVSAGPFFYGRDEKEDIE